jgi:phosphoribosylaminoimidazole-succinocarboxamide synthase
MKKGKKLYEGKAKIIYATTDKNLVIQYFKDDATAFNNLKKSKIEGKGVLNNRISEHIIKNLGQIGIKNHLVKRLNMREQIIKLVEIIPIEFIIRNVATGSITKRLGIEDGIVLKEPLLEYCLKDDKLGDPIVAEEHILAFDWASKEELEKVKKMILRINDFMTGMFGGVGIRLIDFKLEFGRIKINGKSEIILADEISPDTCRLWDSITDKKLDKDRFRKDLGDLIPAYTEVAKRLGILHENSNVSAVNVTKLSSIKKSK